MEIPEAISTLVKPALKSSAMRSLVDSYCLREDVSVVKWGDTKADIPTRANSHIFLALERMQRTREEIKRRVVKEDAESSVSFKAVWDEACAFLLDALLDSLATEVKECAPQNRALMSLDLATLFAGLNDLSPLGEKSRAVSCLS